MTDIKLLIGETVSGRITHTLDGDELPTSLKWADVLNGPGSIDRVTIPEGTVRKYNLKQHTHEWRCFLAVEVNGRIKQAGPIVTRPWDPVRRELTLGARGIWAWLDKRIVAPVSVPFPYADASVSFSEKSLGGIARGIVATATTSIYAQLPIVLPPDETGTRTETFRTYQLLTAGSQLRQITQRAVDAPDIRFVPRRTEADPRYIEWVMLVGTEDRPALYQGGPDWIFDTSAPKSPVVRIGQDSDGYDMAQQVWGTGSGQAESTVMAVSSDRTLLDLPSPWPLTESTISHPTVEEVGTLLEHVANARQQVARPIEVWKVIGRLEAFNEVAPGDYCRTVTVGDAWFGDMDVTTRIASVSGDLSDELEFAMFSTLAAL